METGLVGRRVAEQAAAACHEAVDISRSHGVDLVTGILLDALDGVRATVDTTNPGRRDEASAAAFFTAVAANLQRAAARAGAARVVTLSIVGLDRFEEGYYAGARARGPGRAGVGVDPAGQAVRRVPRADARPEPSRGGRAHPGSARPEGSRRGPSRRPWSRSPRPGDPAASTRSRGPSRRTLARAFAARRGLGVQGVADEIAGMCRALLPGPRARIAGPRFEDWLAGAGALALPL